ncbi:MAG: tRNA preQ1(34) S-adenosylmethionine ribosyltransferase-isomerase QueA [Francisellaceae bacterium]
MKTAQFDYVLPEHLIARYPAENREGSRLLVLNKKTGELDDHHFHEILQYVNPGDLMIFNNSRVMAARLYGQKSTGGQLEFLIERVISDEEFVTHIRANKAPKIGSQMIIADKIANVMDKVHGLYRVKLQQANIWQLMAEKGHMPLPPYMRREDDSHDKERYQTVYSDPLGSVAAPTAGLHFSESLLDALKKKGVEMAFVTLHVGSGTFKPVQVDDVATHVMHKELVEVSQEVCDRVNNTKSRGGRVIAVGTTSVRSLESAALTGAIKPFYGETDIFLYPGKPFHVVDALITNFHLPKSTLIMLVSAFATKASVMAAYQHAIDNDYRFFSYGDAMLIH